MLIGICGVAGAGKSTLADILVKDHQFVSVSLADPLKRICKEVLRFSNEQLWGPSARRNEPDPRYHRSPDRGVIYGLTPRYALQRLGTEWGRDCYPDVWIDLAIDAAKNILSGGYRYNPISGLEPCNISDLSGDTNVSLPCNGVAIPDVRFKNEVSAIKKAGGKVIRIIRPGVGLSGSAGQHVSETEQASIPASEFDLTIISGPISELPGQVEHMFRELHR